MPKAPTSYCVQPGCKERTKGDLCPQHRAPELPRPSAAEMGYDRSWRKLRAVVLQRSPFCCIPLCGAKATDVDHIRPHVKGQPHDIRNLRTMCKRHHSQKTAKQDGGFGNQRR